MYASFSFCMFFWVCVFCVCECEHKYVDVGQQGEKDKKIEKGEKNKVCGLIFSERTTSKKTENREKNRKYKRNQKMREGEQEEERSTEVETETCEVLIVLSENRKCTTPLLPTHFTFLCFVLFSYFLFCLFSYPPSWVKICKVICLWVYPPNRVRIVAKVVALRLVHPL